LGRLRSARRKRRDQEQYASTDLDQQQHRAIPKSAAPLRLQLRLAAGNLHLRAGALPLEPGVFPADAGAWFGIPQEEPRQLVPEMLHRAGQRTGSQRWVLLAPRRYARGIARDRAVVSENHSLFRSIA